MTKRTDPDKPIPELPRLTLVEAERRLNACKDTYPLDHEECMYLACIEARAFLAGREEGYSAGYDDGKEAAYESAGYDISCCCGDC